MKTRTWAIRAGAVCSSLFAIGAILASPALATGPTVTTVGSSKNPSPACSSVTFSATVHGSLFSPVGLVQFFDGAGLLGAPQVATPDFDPDPIFGTHIIPTDHSTVSVSANLSGGTHVITAVYSGNPGLGDLPSTSTPLLQHITAATSTTSVTSTANPSVFGQAFDLVALVSSSCTGSVAGSVQFQADGVDLGGPQAVDGSGHAAVPAGGLPVGTHPVTASFTSTNTDVAGSAGTLAGGQVVDPANTTTGVTASADPTEFGAAVTFVAAVTVDAPGAGTATGSVQFQDNGVDLGAPVALDGNGKASITSSTLSVGSHTISAAFSSNSANFRSSTGAVGHTVTRARTTVAYDGASGADYHDPALLSAKLTRGDDSSPVSGKTVTFTMSAETCSGVTDASGEVSCTIIPSEPAGPYTVSAGFAGDGNFLPSSTSGSFTVTKEETTTTYTGTVVIAQGSPVTLSGRLLEDGVTPVAGRTITLTIGSGATAQSCTGPTNAAGNATCTVPNVTVPQGPQPLTASFAGDPYYLPSSDSGKQAIIFAFPSRGVFVLGDGTVAGAPGLFTFWGAQWTKDNVLSGGGAPSSFTGFADTPSARPPACGGTWTSSPGNSSSPPATVPAYMGTVVSSSISKNGSAISGTIGTIVVVVTAPGYGPDPGHGGTGRVIATYC